MKAYERRAERNKERILRATLELFQVHGIKKTTTHEIALKAGVSPATVYNHFGSKEELVRATVKYFLDDVTVEFRQIINGDRPFTEKLEQIILYKSNMLGQYQGELMQAITSGDPEIRQFMESVMADLRQSIYDFYEEGKRQGAINPELSTETILRYFELLQKCIATVPVLSEDPEYNRKWLQEMVPLFLYGIMGKPGK